MITEILAAFGIGLGLTIYDENKKRKAQNQGADARPDTRQSSKADTAKRRKQYSKVDMSIENAFSRVDLKHLSRKEYFMILTLYYMKYENQVFQEEHLLEIDKRFRNQFDVVELRRDLRIARKAISEGTDPWEYKPAPSEEKEEAEKSYYFLLSKYWKKYENQVFQDAYLKQIQARAPFRRELSEIKRDLRLIREGQGEKIPQKENEKENEKENKKEIPKANKGDWNGQIVMDACIDQYVASLMNTECVIDEIISDNSEKNQFIKEFLSDKCEMAYVLDIWMDSKYKSFRFIELDKNDISLQKVILDKGMMLCVDLKEKDHYQMAHLHIITADNKRGKEIIMGRSLGFTMKQEKWKQFTNAFNMFRLGQMAGTNQTLEEIGHSLSMINVQGWTKDK